MATCDYCGGHGYTAVRNGDDDVTCEACKGAGERKLTLPEALYIVSQNAHGIKHNYFDEYLPAILMVNEAFPVTGYVTIDDEFGDLLYGFGRMISDGNEAAYGLKEQGR